MKAAFILMLLCFSTAVLSSEIEKTYEKARSAFNDNKYNEALIYIKNIIKETPDHLASHILMAEVLIADGSPSAAEIELMTAISLGADQKKLQELLAESYIQQGKFQQTLDFLPEQANNDNLTSNILVLRGDAHLGLRQLKKSQQNYEQSLDFNPNNINAKLGMARILINNYKYHQAEKWVDEVLTEYIPPIKAWNLKASIKQNLGDNPKALEAINQALLINKNDIQALIFSSAINLELSNYDLAEEHADRILAQIPNEPKAEFIKAMVNIRKGNTNTTEDIDKVAEVLEHLSDEVLRSNPSYYYLASIILFHQKNYDASRQYMDAYLFVDENNINALTLAATTELMQKKYVQAKTLLIKANLLEQENPKTLSMLGITYLELKQFDKAHFYFEKVKALKPNLGIVDTQLAQSYLAKGEPTKAIKYLLSEAASTFDPVIVSLLLVEAYVKSGDIIKGTLVAENLAIEKTNDANIQHHLGYIYQINNEKEKAKIQFEKAISLDPKHSKSIVSLAMLELNDNEVDSAINRLKAALKASPNNSQLLITLAKVYNRLERYSEGIILLEKAFKLDGTDEEILKNLIMSYVADEKLLFAIETLNTYLLNRVGSTDLYLILAELHIQNKKVDLAAYAYKEALKFGGEKTDIFLLMAKAYQRFSKVEEAISAFKKAMAWGSHDERPIIGLSQLYNIEQNTTTAVTLIKDFESNNKLSDVLTEILARSYLQLKDYLNAETYYKKLLVKGGTDKSIVGLSLVYQATNRNEDASNLLSDQLNKNPDSMLLGMALAEIHMNNKEWTAADKVYKQLLSVYPEQAALLNNASFIALNLNDLERAQSLAEKSIYIFNDHPDSLDTLGWIFYKTKKYEKALPLFRKALAINYSNPEVRYHLALTLKALNRDKEAIKLMVDVVNSDYEKRVEAEVLLKQWIK